MNECASHQIWAKIRRDTFSSQLKHSFKRNTVKVMYAKYGYRKKQFFFSYLEHCTKMYETRQRSRVAFIHIFKLILNLIFGQMDQFFGTYYIRCISVWVLVLPLPHVHDLRNIPEKKTQLHSPMHLIIYLSDDWNDQLCRCTVQDNRTATVSLPQRALGRLGLAIQFFIVSHTPSHHFGVEVLQLHHSHGTVKM